MNLEEHRRTLKRLRTEALAEQQALDRKPSLALRGSAADEVGDYADKIDEALAQLDVFDKAYA